MRIVRIEVVKPKRGRRALVMSARMAALSLPG